MNKEKELTQFFTDVTLEDNLSYWRFKNNNLQYRILDYTLSEILKRNLPKSTLKSYMISYACETAK